MRLHPSSEPEQHTKVTLDVKVDGRIVGGYVNQGLPVTFNQTIIVANHSHPHSVTTSRPNFAGLVGGSSGLTSEPAGAPEIVIPQGSCPVGGITELTEAAGLPLETAGSPGPSAGLVADVIAVVTAGAFSLGAAVWYGRRRWLRS